MATKNKKDRIPAQPDGMPQGRHLTGFKGSKVDEACFCGRCNPKAKANHGRVMWIVPKNAKISDPVG